MRAVNGVEMEHWQYEVTAGGRIWYCIDDDRRIVWMTALVIARFSGAVESCGGAFLGAARE